MQRKSSRRVVGIRGGRKFDISAWASIAGGLALIGLFMVLLIRAAGSTAIFQSTTAAIAGPATRVSDSSASGGSFVMFNAPVIPATRPTPLPTSAKTTGRL